MQKVGRRNGSTAGRGARAFVLGVLCGLLLPGAAMGELRKVEAVGIHGIREGSRARIIPRDQAVSAAIWEGVSRVALELTGESAFEASDGGEPSQDDVTSLREALGEDVLPYTRGFRILEDKGEVPALFEEQEDVRFEYVVVVEVVVDVDRVSGALERAGLVEGALASGQGGGAIRLELVGLSSYAAYATVVEALEGALGATRVIPLEFSAARQVLSVEGPFEATRLARRLEALDRAGLQLTPLEVDADGHSVRLRGRWAPPPAAPALDPADRAGLAEPLE